MKQGESTLSPEQRVLRSRMAGFACAAKHDGHEMTAAARHASQVTRFERQVDPDGVLEPAERARRAEAARKAYMTGLALASSRARAERKQQKT